MSFSNGEKSEGFWKDDQLVEKRHVPSIMIKIGEEKENYIEEEIPRQITATDMLKSLSMPETHEFEAI